MEERKCSQGEKASSWKKPMNSIQQNWNTEMLTDENKL